MTDYSFNVEVKDTSGTAVESATVKLYDSTNTLLFSDTTNASGVLASNQTVSDSNNPKYLIVSKIGYNSVTQYLNIDNDETNYYVRIEAFTTTYCTVEDVRTYMRLRKQFSGTDTSRTTDADISKRINKAEQYIDNYCRQAWRSTVTEDYYDLTGNYVNQDFMEKVPLKHPYLFNLASGSGDELKVWNGSSYDDYLSDKTEGRANDYWLDYDKGILFIYAYNYGERTLKIKYRHGNRDVPVDIRDACILLVMHDLIVTDQFADSIPEGYNTMQFTDMANRYKNKAQDILRLHRNVFTY